jgi:hypothetical protein
MSTIYLHKAFVYQQPTRAIHPDIPMNNLDFLSGYAIGLRNGLHPQQKDAPFTDEDIIQAIRECVVGEPEALPYILGCYIGGIIASCH